MPGNSATIQLRPAELEDMAPIALILVDSWRHTFAGLLPADFLASLSVEAQQARHERIFAREGVHYQVAVDGGTGEVLGFASTGPGAR